MNRLIFWPPAIRQAQFERFITHGFIHIDPMHLLFNMFTLYFFGSILESFYSKYIFGAGFIVFYLLAIIMAIIPSYINNRHNKNYASLGASGAVSAVLFAFVLFAPWHMIYIFAAIPIPAIIFAVLYVIFSMTALHKKNDNINHSAHLFGALYGIIMTIIFEPAVAKLFLEQLFNPPWL